MIARISLILILFIITIWLMGNLFLILVKGNRSVGDSFFIGFFLYYSIFQILALPLIFTFRPLSWLSLAWGIVIVACFVWTFVLYGRKKNIIKVRIQAKRKNHLSLRAFSMFLLIAFQTYIICVTICNGWDTAYYIPNVNTSIATNTMYLFEGTLGRPEVNMNLRYALSSFYMHDAVLGQVFGVPGTLVCRYFNGIVCSIFSAFIVYKIGLLLFHQKKWAESVVIFWTLTNFGIGTMYFADTFLLERSYEAKAYCCNIVIPAVIYVFLKIYQEPNKNDNWIWLFIVNFSSVAISESSMLLVPILNCLLLLGNCIVEKRIRDLGKMTICLLPNIGYLLVYLFYSLGILTIRITL